MNDFFHKYPHTDFHELNLDWILKFFRESYDFLKSYDNRLKELGRKDEKLEADILKLEQWINNFNPKMVREIVDEYIPTMVMPEISDEGYIVYNIPSTWQDIRFRTTGLDFKTELQPHYGHLVLLY